MQRLLLILFCECLLGSVLAAYARSDGFGLGRSDTRVIVDTEADLVFNYSYSRQPYLAWHCVPASIPWESPSRPARRGAGLLNPGFVHGSAQWVEQSAST